MQMKKIIASIGLLAACMMPIAVGAAGYDPTTVDYGKYSKVDEGTTQTDVGLIAKNIISIIMAFLGLIAVIIIIMAGFKWMTAGGEEKKVEEAKNQLIQGAIGLVIIIASWSIAFFVIQQIVGTVSTGK